MYYNYVMTQKCLNYAVSFNSKLGFFSTSYLEIVRGTPGQDASFEYFHLIFFFCDWLELTEVSSGTIQLGWSHFLPCLERGIQLDMLSNLVIFHWFQFYFILTLFELVRGSIRNYFAPPTVSLLRVRDERRSAKMYNLATLQTPLATFFPSKKRPNLI